MIFYIFEFSNTFRLSCLGPDKNKYNNFDSLSQLLLKIYIFSILKIKFLNIKKNTVVNIDFLLLLVSYGVIAIIREHWPVIKETAS